MKCLFKRERAISDRERALEEEVDNPSHHISEESDNDENASFDVESFPTESDKSITGQNETTQKGSIRRRSNKLRVRKPHSRPAKVRHISVTDRDNWKDGCDFEPKVYDCDESNSGITIDCNLNENSSESDFCQTSVT